MAGKVVGKKFRSSCLAVDLLMNAESRYYRVDSLFGLMLNAYLHVPVGSPTEVLLVKKMDRENSRIDRTLNPKLAESTAWKGGSAVHGH